MKKLISSGKDAEYAPGIVDRIEWACLKQLYVLAVQYEAEPRKWDFIAEAVFHDDTFIELSHDRDIATARKICACLSAIHDKPVVDWTRPAPSGLTLETFRGDIARYMAGLKEAVTRSEWEEPKPPAPPVWGAGWENTDYLFLDGATDEEFVESLDELERTTKTWAGVNLSDLKAAHRIIRDEAVRRWLMLHAANTKPEPKQGELA
ncbi:hypothetical protein LHT11_01560 [Acetobacter indonesiensis]|uniref:hypothetical protein n=1 Tax=Acetobacter indonesiensis TaxID=104101 RepID=UPI001F2721BB|nr:hypothetical protein [Acetobacter indonesiensis]MCG0993887.1 hypothetical protein [Acetobacter indonesiensis]